MIDTGTNRISARFAIRRGEFRLDADLNIPARGVSALLGPSGCGKTSLLRAMAGLDRYADGYFQLGDSLWQDQQQFVPPHRRALGYVFQEASLFAHLTVQANMDYGLKRVAAAERKVSLQQAIELLDIGDLLQRKPATLSGGEQRRVAIARALAVSPRLLLMDESLAGLDYPRKQEILPYIDSLHRELNIPVIYVSHAADEVARLADHLVLLDKHGVVASGGMQDLFTRLDLPLVHDNRAAAVIDAQVSAHDENYHLTRLSFAGGDITVAGKVKNIGDAVRVQLPARDVSITLEQQSDTSILNIFAATVDSLSESDTDAARLTVKLMAGGVPILSRITRKSADELGLRPGLKVYAQVKSVALLT